VSGEHVDVNIDDVLLVLNKEQLFKAACSMQVTEIQWLSVMLGRFLSGDYTRERNLP